MDANASPHAAQVAADLAAKLNAGGQDYAIGGAIALGFWGNPRGTLDVDLTVFLSHDQPTAAIRLLQQIGCVVDAATATETLREHGFCRASFQAMRVDVFLPTIPFYELARARRRKFRLLNQDVWVWDAETLAVFKLMFFRRKDLADLEQILRSQGSVLDRDWIRTQLVELFGARDPRVSSWDELVQEVSA